MYLSVNAGSNFHIWRQRFPDGKPEQLTSGPTDEEGIAVAPDGRSLITAVGLRQRPIWFHDASGDHQVSLEGYAFDPRLYFASKKVCYRIGRSSEPRGRSQLWLGDLDSGQNELLLPGFDVLDYDLSADGQIVVSALDAEGKPNLWLGWLDRRSPPRQIPSGKGVRPYFGPTGDIFFVASEGTGNFLFRIRSDGTGGEKVSPQPAEEIHGVSPDGAWVAGLGSMPGEPGWFEFAYPTNGGKPIPLCSQPCVTRWAPDRKFLYFSVPSGYETYGATGRTYILPTRPGSMLPEMPAGGFRSEAQLAAVPGVRIIQAADVHPGPTPDVYVYSRETTQRNLFRTPLR